MPSDVEICNLALTKLGQQRILTLTANEKAARSLNAIYAMERDAELRSHVWNFAKRRRQLSEVFPAPPFGYKHQYQLPADYLRLLMASDSSFPGSFYPGARRVLGTVSEEAGADWTVENGMILTDKASPINLRYIARVTEPGQFDPCFVEALASRLAVIMAEDLAQSSQKKKDAQGEYMLAIKAAIRANAIELPPDTLPDNTWVLSRLPG